MDLNFDKTITDKLMINNPIDKYSNNYYYILIKLCKTKKIKFP